MVTVAFVTAFVASLIRRNVQPLFRPWFVASEGVRYLGAIVRNDGLDIDPGYTDLYVSRKGEYLARFGNGEADYGCLGDRARLEGLGDKCPANYRFAMALHAKIDREGRKYVPSAYSLAPKAPATVEAIPEEPCSEPEPPTCSMCDAYGHGYPGGGPCPLEERGAAELDAYGYLS